MQTLFLNRKGYGLAVFKRYFLKNDASSEKFPSVIVCKTKFVIILSHRKQKFLFCHIYITKEVKSKASLSKIKVFIPKTTNMKLCYICMEEIFSYLCRYRTKHQTINYDSLFVYIDEICMDNKFDIMNKTKRTTNVINEWKSTLRILRSTWPYVVLLILSICLLSAS